MSDRVLIIDGLNLIHRSNIRATKNLGPYIIVFNFFKSLRSLVEKFPCDKIFFVREGKNNFRYKLFEGYKANRIIKNASITTKKEQDDFNRQRDLIFDLLKYLPISQIYADGYEGDDIINTLCQDLQGEQIIIVSNDQDLTQILQKNLKGIQIYDPFKKIFVETPKAFILCYKAIYGDPSDNIPGLGINKKKAEELALNPDKLSKFLDESEERRVQFNDNIDLIRLRIVPGEELIMIDGEINWTLLKIEFKNMDFQSLIRSDVWIKFVDTFKKLTI